MFQQMKKRIKNEKGLTLIELLAVIVILAIIAAIAIPAIGNIIQNSRDKAVLSEAVNVLSGAKIAHTEGACDATTSCLGTDLNEYVDGITLTDATVVKLGSDGWTINYENFSDIATDSKYATSGDTTEEALKDLLDPNGND